MIFTLFGMIIAINQLSKYKKQKLTASQNLALIDEIRQSLSSRSPTQDLKNIQMDCYHKKYLALLNEVIAEIKQGNNLLIETQQLRKITLIDHKILSKSFKTNLLLLAKIGIILLGCLFFRTYLLGFKEALIPLGNSVDLAMCIVSGILLVLGIKLWQTYYPNPLTLQNKEVVLIKDIRNKMFSESKNINLLNQSKNISKGYCDPNKEEDINNAIEIYHQNQNQKHLFLSEFFGIFDLGLNLLITGLTLYAPLLKIFEPISSP